MAEDRTAASIVHKTTCALNATGHRGPCTCGAESSAATDREFLTDVRVRASDTLTKDICALDSEADPADVHEDVREALWPFFLEIRDRFGVEGDV